MSISTKPGADAPRVICVTRCPGELLVSVNRKAGDGDGEFENVSMPLSRVARSVYPGKDRLQESWMRLSAVQAVDAETLYHILTVLLETVPAISSKKSAGTLPAGWNAAPVSARPTEAHPRAFSGTKYRPPKMPRLPATDIRPHLCESRALKAVLSPLWKFLPLVRARLAKDGYDEAALEACRNGPWSLPDAFVRSLWPAVQGGSRRDCFRLLSLFSELGLEGDSRLRAAFARFVILVGVDLACRWKSVGEALPRHRLTVFFEKLIATGACLKTPPPHAALRVEETSRLADDERFPLWAEALLRTTERGLSTDYLLAGFRLAAQFSSRLESFSDDVARCDNFPLHMIEEIAAAPGFPDWGVLWLWRQCGTLPGFADLIQWSKWRSFTEDAARSYLWFFVNSSSWDDRTGRISQKKWAAVAEHIPQIEGLILETPSEYQYKAVELISAWPFHWAEPAAIRKSLPQLFRILRRFAAPPFEVGESANWPCLQFAEMENALDFERFLRAHDACFHSLEAACRRANDAILIGRGLEPLIRLEGRFTVDAFTAEPNRLWRTAKLLGSTSYALRYQIVKELRVLPLWRIDPLKTELRELCTAIHARRKGSQENPIPARLSSWWRGQIELSPARLERYHRVLAEKFILTRLSLIEETAVESLKRGLPAGRISKAEQHALRLLGSLDWNRRGLRKFLKAYWAGDQRYLSSHPATIAWYRKHRQIPRDVWEEGVPFERVQLSIRVERDPFEILKLGTYVGSCLGAGGIQSDSAVAALLDANKRVLYARDHARRVVARQLVAISDDDRLVCFAVYPRSASKQVQALFREYDFAWAGALGIQVYQSAEPGAGYDVGCVLSADWYDDGNWDFEIQA